MGLQDQFREAGRIRQKAKEQSRVRNFQQSRQRLLQILEKKLRTTFIGAISAIEESPFGRLWAHGSRPDERSENQQRWFELWQQLRTRILNNGNNQLRAVQNELELYEVEYQGYRTVLPVRNPNQ